MPTSRFEMRVSETAGDLEQWFDHVIQLLDDSLFAAATGPGHRNALYADVISRNARALCQADVDTRGEMYTPLCILISALSRRLALSIRREHWKAAIENVIHIKNRLDDAKPHIALGLAVGTPAGFFKGLMCEALRNAGVLGEPTQADDKSRRLASGLAVNWALRLLLAYALAATKARRTSQQSQDLSWIRSVLEPLT